MKLAAGIVLFPLVAIAVGAVCEWLREAPPIDLIEKAFRVAIYLYLVALIAAEGWLMLS